MTDQEPYVPFAAPFFDDADVAAVTEVLRRGWVSTGPEAAAFEREFAELTGRRHAVALNSCTAALHLVYAGLGIGPGDEVIVPALTFTATAAAVAHTGATPVIVDVDESTLNLSVDAVAAALTPRTKAVVPVHFAGRMVDLETLHALLDGTGVAVVEDAAHALPAYRDGRIAGSWSTAAAFSFFATKPITTGEGGMLVTDDDHLEQQARILSQHGISREAAGRHAPGGSAHYDVFAPGFKYNMSDLQAALGRTQLAKHPDLWARRRAVTEVYAAGLADLPELELPAADTADDLSSWHLYAVRLRLDRLAVDRDELARRLHQAGVGTSVHFRPLHTYQWYRETLSTGALPVAEAVYPRLLSLPLSASMAEQDAQRVVRTIRDECARRA